MRAIALALCLAAVFAMQARTQEAVERRFTTDAEAARWSGVGLIDLPNGVCTGALIAPKVVMTAAHCVADAEDLIVAEPELIRFRAGWRDGAAAALGYAARIDVSSGFFAAGGAYDERQIRADVALVHLLEPIPESAATPIAVGAAPEVGAELVQLGYSGGRTNRLSIQAPCRVTGRRTEFLTLDCISEPGASGSPLVRLGPGGDASIVALISGARVRRGERSALALSLDHLRDWLSVAKAGSGPPAPTSPGFKPASGGLPGARKAGEGLKALKR